LTNRTISQVVCDEVNRRLNEVEAANSVKVLLAVESGSRAWGFASTDSDYDVRFIYLSPAEWYVSVDLEEKRDVIETPIEGVWDVNGWDLRKALRLYRKSNPPLLEWLHSPIVYREKFGAAQKMRDLLPTFYSPRACMYHYLHMARGNHRGYLQSDTVKTKKYFYVLRPLLGCRWIEKDIGSVPMEFERLVEGTDVPAAVRSEIDALLEKKRSAEELASGPRNEVLSRFIEAEFQRHSESGLAREKPQSELSQLNTIFREALKEAWNP
jgi:uncharacterized protein